jgi:DNA invertase Pin-like site-specific DNA recombinase
MSTKIVEHHREKPAYVYVRQSTLGQVRHHQESTERQYALRDKAMELGWGQERIRILDRDLGKSGAHTTGREDFKSLVADVATGEVGAVFALEASRLARSSLEWHRLIELCAMMGTLVIDEDGCYDPADFNDGLLLGLKGTLAQAELHFLHARLQGGKLNKAKKGELRFPLPVGLCYDAQGTIVLDPDEEVRGVVSLVFELFRDRGSAYGVVQRFNALGLRFPKRAYGGAWAGKLIWGRLTHSRVLGILKNPSYAGVYVYGRYQSHRELSSNGEIQSTVRAMPKESWRVTLEDHHQGYITGDEYERNQAALAKNRTNGEQTVLSGPAREGLAMLQGLLLCGSCGRKLTVRYRGNGGLYPVYECNHRRREGLSTRSCMSLRCDLLDAAMSEQVLEMLRPAQLALAVEAVKELETRDRAVCQQWEMRLKRAEYDAQLADRRYQEIDPSNRLVAATLEKRWNNALEHLEELKLQYEQFRHRETRIATEEQRKKVLALAEDFPRLWHAPTTAAKDRKRMLRLLIRDITVEKRRGEKQAVLHVRWQGGACCDVSIQLPANIADRMRYSPEILERVQALAPNHSNKQLAERLNAEGHQSSSGKPFSASMISWIRYRYQIPKVDLKKAGELTVDEVAQKFGVSHHVVYYWIHRGVVQARRLHSGAPYWITLSAKNTRELLNWVKESKRIGKVGDSNTSL